jgi:hypothetical protein
MRWCAALPPRRVFSLFMRRRSSASMATTRIINGSNLFSDSSDGLRKLKNTTALSEVFLGSIAAATRSNRRVRFALESCRESR